MADEKIAVVIGSTRPTRICATIAGWARDTLTDSSPLSYQLLDLAEIGLPFLDEPLMPALGHYQHEHTRQWSRIVRTFDGFLFVFPQYNWGYPGVLKNALDFLHDEWTDRPATYLTYGSHGGSAAAEPFARVLRGLDMAVLDTHIEAVIGRQDIDANWQLTDPAATLELVREQLTAIDSQFRTALRIG
jgi:NAD(P)H-dependent FMN reductase